LPPSDKVSKKNVFQPENGIWTYCQIRGNNPTANPGGMLDLSSTLLPLGKSMEASSKYMGDLLIAALRNPDTKVAKLLNFRILFSRKIIENNKEETYKTMSETYNDKDTTMGDIFEKI